MIPANEALPVAVVIANYNGRRYLEPCLSALFRQSYPLVEVVLVDNASTDGSAEWVQRPFPRVQIIPHSTNVGFAAAMNAGIRATRTPLVATLNNDTVAEPDWLLNLVSVLQRDPQAGMAASKMLFVSMPRTINSAGISLDRVGIAWDRCGGRADDADTDQIVEVFGACAGAALYRRAMLDQIGLFDEDFFAYLEDVDLAWRAQLAGWRALYVPTARVTHWHSATSGEGSPFKSRLLGRNKVWLIAKNYPAPYLYGYLPAIIAYDVMAVGYALLKRRDLSSLQGRLAGLRALPVALRKRKQVQSLRRVPARAVMRRMEPLMAPWTVAQRYAHLRTVARMA